VDAEMIRRVLINLIENAVKFNAKEGVITIEGAATESKTLISIQDQGPGIAPEDHQDIFNKYARLSSQAQGFGLGLAFCRLAIEAHGGKIWVESAPNEGARFLFNLPLWEA
jgi:signal transduction histidine kinase